MSGNMEGRLRALEMSVPADIVLTLDDGTTVERPGPALEFFMEATEQIARKRGPLFDVAHRVVSVTGFGKLFEVLLAMLEGPVQQPPPKPLSRKRKRKHQCLRS